MKTRWNHLAVAVVVGAVVFTGCSFEASVGNSGLDMQELEKGIFEGIEEQTGAELESVECPDEMDEEEGLNFECTATDTTGESVQVRVVQTDDDGNVEWEIINE
jgi:hypothetical protein